MSAEVDLAPQHRAGVVVANDPVLRTLEATRADRAPRSRRLRMAHLLVGGAIQPGVLRRTVSARNTVAAGIAAARVRPPIVGTLTTPLPVADQRRVRLLAVRGLPPSAAGRNAQAHNAQSVDPPRPRPGTGAGHDAKLAPGPTSTETVTSIEAPVAAGAIGQRHVLPIAIGQRDLPTSRPCPTVSTSRCSTGRCVPNCAR